MNAELSQAKVLAQANRLMKTIPTMPPNYVFYEFPKFQFSSPEYESENFKDTVFRARFRDSAYWNFESESETNFETWAESLDISKPNK